MPHFKTLENKLYYLTDDDVAEGWVDRLPAGSAPVTDAEAEAIRAAGTAEGERDYKHFTGLAKLDLFTEGEQEAVIAAGISGDVQVKRFYDRLLVADHITYSHPEVELGLQLLVARELLTAERQAAIVATMTATRE